MSHSPQLCRCLPKRCRAPTHGRRQHSWWSEPSPPGGTARLATGTPRRWPPLSSGPTSVWRQPSLSAALHGRQRAAQSFWCGPGIICCLSWCAQGNRWWEGLRWSHRYANQEQNKDEWLVEISTLLIHSAPKQKSNQWMHLSPFCTRMHGEWLRYAKSTSQFHWRFLFSQRWSGLPSKSPNVVTT